jgi:hypothetical protein
VRVQSFSSPKKERGCPKKNRAAMGPATEQKLILPKHCKVRVSGAVLFLILPLFGLTARQKNEHQDDTSEKRLVTVADTIEMTQVAGPAAFSPDGTRFVIVLMKGNLRANANQYSILLYQTKDVFELAKPIVLLTMSSSSNREAVRYLRWLQDNKTLVFVGENPGEVAQIYSLNIESRTIRRLTNSRTAISDFDVSKDGRQMVYAADHPARNCSEPASTPEIVSPGVTLPEFLSNGSDQAQTWRKGQQIFLQHHGKPAHAVPIKDYVADWSHTLKMSPDGQYAVVGVIVREIPVPWAQYRDGRLQQLIRVRRPQGSPVHFLERYLLIDTRRTSAEPLLDTPMIGFRPFQWAADSQSVILKSVFLPLNVQDPVEREERSENTHDVEVLVPTKEPRKIASTNLAKQWTKELPIRIEIRQDLNTPPKIYAVSKDGGRSAMLLDPNPSFAKIELGTVEVIEWRATDGHKVQGELYRPVNFSPGKRYPLVIQTHGFSPNEFWMDGPWGGAFAARSLAGEGLMVLQVGYDHSSLNTPKEGPGELASFEGAINYLDEKGLIDRRCVGIVGFSRTVFHVEYALTHSKHLFAAANLVDGIDAGYFQYLAFGPGDNILLNGGIPFTDGFRSWLANSPSFTLGNVDGAIRLEAHGGSDGVLSLWEWFVGLSQMDRAVELAYLPLGSHILVKPREKMVAEQSMVDWFCFWLKGEVDPRPEKHSQYERWRKLAADSKRAASRASD